MPIAGRSPDSRLSGLRPALSVFHGWGYRSGGYTVFHRGTVLFVQTVLSFQVLVYTLLPLLDMCTFTVRHLILVLARAVFEQGDAYGIRVFLDNLEAGLVWLLAFLVLYVVGSVARQSLLESQGCASYIHLTILGGGQLVYLCVVVIWHM